MHILALENSTSTGSLVLWDGEKPVFEESFSAPRGHGAAVFEVLQKCLKEDEVFDRIAVGTGPGSYNGIRIALAAAKGIQIAREISFVAVSSALCLPSEGAAYVYFGDARGGQFHFSKIVNRAFQDGPRLVTPAELEALLAQAECPLYSDAVHADISSVFTVEKPSARILAKLAVSASDAEVMPEPLYLKPPHITVPRSAQGCNQTPSE